MTVNTRLRGQTEEGFTLIELLVVIIIIGILSTIAIPVFLRQRQKAVEASLKSDMKTVANELESYQTDDLGYPLGLGGTTLTGTATIGSGSARLSANNSVAVTFNAAGNAYCLKATNIRASRSWFYVSTLGGIQAAGTTACPVAF